MDTLFDLHKYLSQLYPTFPYIYIYIYEMEMYGYRT